MDALTVVELAALAVAAMLVGFSKTAVSGTGLIAVAVFASVLPARESTGALLPLLLVGDLLAVAAYRRHANWALLARLLPSVAVGILIGYVFISRVDDVVMRRTIGAMVLALAVGRLVQQRHRRGGEDDNAPEDPGDGGVSAGPDAEGDQPAAGRGPAVISDAHGGSDDGVVSGSQTLQGRGGRRVAALLTGSLSGFTTMVANSGGPVMSLYLLSAGAAKMMFLGTAAWFFLVVNLVKVPFSLRLGLIDGGSLAIGAVLAPAIILGAVLGRSIVGRIDDVLFQRLVLAATVISSLYLLR